MRSKRLAETFDRLAAAEERFFRSEFLAPVFPGDAVRVRIDGVVCRVRVEPADFEGWGVFRPQSAAIAKLVRPADLSERARYLELFPRVRLILCRRDGSQWLTLAAHRGARRGRIWCGRRIGRCSGRPAQVEFDGPAVLAREEERGDVIGFLHTHPQFAAQPSRRDVHTMRAWVGAFGKPLLCLIRGVDGLAGFRFDDDGSEGAALAAVEEFPRGIVIGVDSDGGKASPRRTVSRPRRR